MQHIIETVAQQIKLKFDGEGTGHDWCHIYRVWQMAITIAKEEGANLYVVELGALLHDIADWKFNDGDEKAGGKEVSRLLKNLNVDETTIAEVAKIVDGVSYKGAGVNTEMQLLEGKIVQDADRLDALGAIGIARTFAYGGSKNRAMYDPEIKPELHQSFEAYKKSTTPTINHFYEKLLLLKDRMNTKCGKRMAEERHQFMESYLRQFYLEWEGKV